MRGWVVVMGLALGGPAWGQGFPSLPSLSGPSQAETPEQRRAFCGRVASAASSCGFGIGVQALTACVVRALPMADSMRVARVAGSAGGDASSVLRECGVGAR